MKHLVCLVAFLVFSVGLRAQEKSREGILKEEGRLIFEKNKRIAKEFYSLEENEDFKEITALVVSSSETKAEIKQRIAATGRRFFLFRYPSDGFRVKGYISFVPKASGNPLLILLRGGNRNFGLMNPATDFSCIRDYTIIATTYRGGVSEGEDQFGGAEVNDVENLVKYLPILEQKLSLPFNPKSIFILGASRGGMEMFLALGRSSFLQHYVTKAASLSGLLDLEECMRFRKDIYEMFVNDFGLIPGVNENEWINGRNPLYNVGSIRADLPFLIVQGTKDLRVRLEEGLHMVQKLQENGNTVEYREIQEGEHCLSNQPNRMEWIADWFEH